MNESLATREVFWNITNIWAMYVQFAVALTIAGYGLYRRVHRWRAGLPSARFDRPAARWRLLFRHAIAQGRTVREKSSAIFHSLIYTGFITLIIATTVVFIDYDLGVPLMRGQFYLYFQSLTVDVFGAFVIVGICIALVRRAVTRPKKLVFTSEVTFILLAILAIALTGFLIEGWRIAVTRDVWGTWSPFGYLIARLSTGVMSEEAMRSAHAIVWWTHASMFFAFLAWAPYTKMAHVIFGPLNIYFASTNPARNSL